MSEENDATEASVTTPIMTTVLSHANLQDGLHGAGEVVTEHQVAILHGFDT